ncbi:hypothetical protein BURMUCGD2_6135 [Burkholderia multivorans CGD2]|uniref:Uncharacterized protein n=1 Tax=Burkholderia multivorans CGD2 TaxID=513052 RepID=B9BWP8_9BURK|nr:hypothetical protein BURMUCGD2_6135 [Burkholderia multivorans CGD2]
MPPHGGSCGHATIIRGSAAPDVARGQSSSRRCVRQSDAPVAPARGGRRGRALQPAHRKRYHRHDSFRPARLPASFHYAQPT